MNDDMVCKVADFGMSRELQNEEETYNTTVASNFSLTLRCQINVALLPNLLYFIRPPRLVRTPVY